MDVQQQHKICVPFTTYMPIWPRIVEAAFHVLKQLTMVRVVITHDELK